MSTVESGNLERIARALMPVSVEMFNHSQIVKALARGESLTGMKNKHDFYVDGKTLLVLQVLGLPVTEEGNCLGEILFEGSIDGTSYFEICRISANGIFNLADEVAKDVAKGFGHAIVRPGSRIVLHKIRAIVSKYPLLVDPGQSPLSVFLYGVNG